MSTSVDGLLEVAMLHPLLHKAAVEGQEGAMCKVRRWGEQ